MPCDGIAVALGQIPLELARYLDIETARVGLLTLLAKEYPQLGKPVVVSSGSRSVSICLGAYTLSLHSDGVEVAGPRGAQLNELQERVTALLKGLAGLALQQDAMRQLRGMGARIAAETRAPNGAVVLSVEL
jgi:hypothetical protein